jgi:cytoskeletal protein RodZ
MIKSITLLVILSAIGLTVFLGPMNIYTSAQQNNQTNQTNTTSAQQPDLSNPDQIQRTQNQVQLAEEQIQTEQRGNNSLPEQSQQSDPLAEKQLETAKE